MDLSLVTLLISLANLATLIIFFQRQQKNNQSNEYLTKMTMFEAELKGNLSNLPELLKAKMGESFEAKLSPLRQAQTNELHLFKENLERSMKESFEKLSLTVENRLEKISEKLKENLEESFKKTNLTFNSVIERLARIDEAQKKIEHLSQNVVSLQSVLTDKKGRGIFGEVQLNQILASVFGDKNEKIYSLQYGMENGTIVDAALFLPEPMGLLPVDSKFPLENYRRMLDQNLSSDEREAATREFKKNVKKHIDDIATKYIIPGKTSDQAVMFLPAEAIFAELHAYHDDVIEYANKKKVWATSPTTFMAVLTTIQVVLNNIERNKYTTVIHEELNKLGDEFKRYKQRWDKLASHIDTISKDVKDIHVTSEKISSKFENIAQVNLEKNSTIELN